jgi:hypothetical protein
LELDYTASAKCRFGISHHSIDNQAPKKEHLMKSGISANTDFNMKLSVLSLAAQRA